MSGLLPPGRSLSGGPPPGISPQTLLEIARSLTAVSDYEEVLATILDTAIRQLKAEMGILVLQNPEGELEAAVARNFEEKNLSESEVQMSRGVLRRVTTSGESACVTDAMHDQRFSGSESVQDLALRSILCVPLRVRGAVAGALYLENRSVAGIFGEPEKLFLEAIAALAAIGLDNARLYEELNRRGEALSEENARLRIALREPQHFEGFIGKSPAMQRVFHLIRRVADSRANVLVRGESGTGKELVARTVHDLSPRHSGPFIQVNCAAIPETLLESEFFGIARGTATGVDARMGRFEQADGGTLFLDEIGDMGMSLQAKILRVVQERVFERVGGRESIKVDVRLVAATNRNLEAAVADGSFRQDLFFRLNVVPLVLPPLRERMSDVPALAELFLERFARENNRGCRGYTRAAMERLMSWHWPGNIRELENVVAQAVILSEGGRIETHDLPAEIREPRGGMETGGRESLDAATAAAERKVIAAVLEEHGWNRVESAAALGVSRVTLYKKMKRYGIAPGGASPGT